MNILGWPCCYYDFATLLLRDWKLVAAAEEERFSWIKHDNGFSVYAIRFSREIAGHSRHCR